jgi:hypothetical protein
MIISYTHPYELTQTPMFADTEKDFEKIPVKSSGYIESNKFLVSLWNQVNTHINPKHCVDRAPWAYSPGKYVGKKTSVSALGFCQTSIGELYFALEYHKKGDIDSLLVMRPTSKLKHEEIEAVKRSKLAPEAQAEKIVELRKECKELKHQAREIQIKNMKEFESILTDKQKKELKKIKEEGRKNFEKNHKKNIGKMPPRDGFRPKPPVEEK